MIWGRDSRQPFPSHSLSPFSRRRTQNFWEVHFKVEQVVAPASGILPEPEVQGVEAGSEIHLGPGEYFKDGMVVVGNHTGTISPTTCFIFICLPCSEQVYQRENAHV